MRKNHSNEELELQLKLTEAEWNLFEFYTNVQHRSKKYAGKKVFRWTDEQYETWSNACKKITKSEKEFVVKADKLTRKGK